MELAKFKKLLLEQKAEYESRLAEFKKVKEVPFFENIQELSFYDNHPGDLGSESFERSKDLALLDNLQVKLRQIDEALALLSQGKYGVCIDCGQKIPEERLLANPVAIRCVDCQKKVEERTVPSIRPIEEQILSPFLEKFNLDNTTQTMFDGEDSWQAVASFNLRENIFYEDLPPEENNNSVEEVDSIPYEVGDNGVFYQNYRGLDDEGKPREYHLK
ncbi:TraR/DksA C4-type zinc finger protein [Carboxydothermus pertinax]|uniref:Zinc finger DksA/TraR C4-type domain-containing protein n=1 Tax=Carboxydothermus pertinax TaxID=870242 RepID=A0A1L8CY10_9THEO|nr:TraR/DksA C4-type zinc finger protein [Carboxydothermus pertinax]GAV23749.1 hypothetical protein cpu_22590 [Carboxydothermus pertinax]